MAISKAMRAALSILSYPEIDVKKSYLVEREVQKLLSHRLKNAALYHVWDHPVFSGVHSVPMRIFKPAFQSPPCCSSFTAEAGLQARLTAMMVSARIWPRQRAAP